MNAGLDRKTGKISGDADKNLSRYPKRSLSIVTLLTREATPGMEERDLSEGPEGNLSVDTKQISQKKRYLQELCIWMRLFGREICMEAIRFRKMKDLNGRGRKGSKIASGGKNGSGVLRRKDQAPFA